VRTAARSDRPKDDDGYVAVDAGVALLILALSAILSLQAIRVAYQAAAAALENKRAQILLSYVMDYGPRSLTPSSGSTDGFVWRVATQPLAFAQPISICRRAVTLLAQESGRSFAASTREVCPTEPTS
jgi:hypothetical protein